MLWILSVTNGQTDGHTDGRTRVKQYAPYAPLVVAGA